MAVKRFAVLPDVVLEVCWLAAREVVLELGTVRGQL